ncbi:MAG: response regulator transcription factor [Gemmatimonadetes bacterium]|nr:response regulator transcription factor [Gemmatimonadota bacterium]
MPHILVVDDDSSITSVLKRGLAFEGFSVDVAESGRSALTLARDRAPDAIVLDVMLPEIDGFEVLRRVRAADHNVPVMMLSARDECRMQLQGFDDGADDYVSKPFSIELIAARLRALLRRRDLDAPAVLRFADLSLDTGTRRATRGARDIALTTTEYEVLRQFLLHPRRVLPKHLLMDRVWGYRHEGSDNLLEVYVKQLPQKLEDVGERRLIHTLRGAGYVIRET